ncbi:MAG: Hint domain-containing protein, partial [Saprospiraceae bacterium]
MKYLIQILLSFFGCMNTPVLMAGKSDRSGLQDQNEAMRNGFIDCEPSQTWLGLDKCFKNTGYGLALAAMPIITPVPIQDVQLFDYALANKTVNSSYHLTASTSDNVYTDLMNGDPYTSQEQKLRDLYEINDTDWNAVSFEGVQSTSVCHLAMHQDWITNHGYVVNGIVNMNLPEQGISGPFKITSIKHILPQKKPESDPGDGYEWKPVTGLFIHHSDQVYDLTISDEGRKSSDTKSLDSAGTATNRIAASTTTLGVTYNHPIFSTTHNDWRLAGELEVGEKVLTYNACLPNGLGEATVTKTEMKAGSEAVYNLEVKDLHNFLVGEFGVVVHNTGLCDNVVRDWLKKNHPSIGTNNIKKPGTKHGIT